MRANALPFCLCVYFLWNARNTPRLFNSEERSSANSSRFCSCQIVQAYAVERCVVTARRSLNRISIRGWQLDDSSLARSLGHSLWSPCWYQVNSGHGLYSPGCAGDIYFSPLRHLTCGIPRVPGRFQHGLVLRHLPRLDRLASDGLALSHLWRFRQWGS